jgi:hypothetical protein
MLEDRIARLRTHRHNISRYRRLLRTKLTDLERDFILRRLEEEELAARSLSETNIQPAAPQPRSFAKAIHV